jgi:Zn-dependent peptidase ImmA (M78 family)
MWHPWRTLCETLPLFDVRFTSMPDGYDGSLDLENRIIWIERRLSQAQRRWTLTHELVHQERGHDGHCDERVEESVDAEAARRLIELEDLADAAVWARTLYELAAELWVPPIAVVVRFDHMHPAERAYLRRRVAAKEG